MKFNDIFIVQKVLRQLGTSKLPVKTSYKIAKLLLAIDEEAKLYDKQFEGIRDTYAETTEDGNFVFTEDGRNIKIKEGLEKECNAAVLELNNIEVELPNVIFSIDELAESTISAEELVFLFPFIEDI